MNTGLHFSSLSPEWGTPQQFFNDLNEQWNFTLDPCATPQNAKCAKFFTKEQDGLKQSWANEVVFMNPPYGDPEQPCKLVPGASLIALPVYNAKGVEVSRHAGTCNKKKCSKRGYHVSEYIPGIIDFMRKAHGEARDNKATVVCLVPSRTDTKWFHRYALRGTVTFIEGRLKFNDGSDPAPFPSAVVVFTPKR